MYFTCKLPVIFFETNIHLPRSKASPTIVFFNPVFKVYFDEFLKKFVLKIVISISLNYIDSNLAIIFITHDTFQNK